MVGLANPWGLLALASVGVLIALTLLSRRRRTSPVSTLLLWRQIAARSVERQRFRPDLLFALRLLLLLALGVAYAQPFRTRPAGGADLAIVLDVSASMQVQETDGSRFDLARRQLDSLLAGLPPDAAVLLVGAADRPRVALRWSADRTRLAEALAALAPLDTPTALASAVRLALGEASRRAGARVAVVTDLPPGATDLAEGELGAVKWRTVGRRGDNVAVTALAATAPPFAAPQDVDVEVAVRNFGDAVRTVSLDASIDDVPWKRHAVSLGAGGERRLRLGPPPRAGLLRVALDGGDALAADDRALAWIPSEPPLDVLLVTGSDALAEAMGALMHALPAARLEVVNEAGLRERTGGTATAGQITVYDRVVPADRPGDGALYLAPPPGNSVCPSAREVEYAAVVDWEPRHPLLRGLHGLEAVEAERAVQLLPPDWGVVVMTAASRRAAYPFLVAGERDGQRQACLAAALPPRLTTSEALPLVLLMLGTLRWLAEPAAAAPLAVATGVPTQASGALAARRHGDVRAVGEPPVVLATRAGVHRLRDTGGGERLVLASLLDEAESNVGRMGGDDRPAATVAPASPASSGRADLSRWLYAAAALLLALEWAVWGLTS